jgi:acyl carrier protein
MPTPQTVERLAAILRRDLKLDPAMPLDASTPLLGGPHDMDSLDILLVITSVEKEFGTKIPNEAIGKNAFLSVGTLAEFLEQRLAD